MLAKLNRLRSQSDFAVLAKKGKRVFTPFFILYFLSNSTQVHARFGIVISNKTSKKATQRNQLRRRLRACLYEKQNTIKPGDYMFVIQKKALAAKPQDLKKNIEQALQKVNRL